MSGHRLHNIGYLADPTTYGLPPHEGGYGLLSCTAAGSGEPFTILVDREQVDLLRALGRIEDPDNDDAPLEPRTFRWIRPGWIGGWETGPAPQCWRLGYPS